MTERRSIDPKLSFLAGWFLGRRSRRRSGIGCLVLILALFAGMSAVASFVSTPLVWNASRQTANLPRPVADELTTMTPGIQLLTMAQVPSDLPVDTHGLALFRRETYVDYAADQNSNRTASSGWHVTEPSQARIGMYLLDGTPLLVQLVPEASFLNAQTIDVADSEPRLRYVGYLPGQTLTLHGIWEGDNLFTVENLYAGTVDDYLAYQARMPGTSLMMAFLCGGITLLLLVGGGILRVFGR